MRKIMILIISILLTGTFTYADPQPGLQLQQWGVVNGELMGERELTREMALTYYIRLLGEEKDALAYNGNMSYTDVPKNHWSYKFIAYAETKKYTQGMGNHTFGLGQVVTTQQMVAFMLRGLGYFDINYTKVVDEGLKLGVILEKPNNQEKMLVRADSFVIMMNTLNVAKKGSNKSLKYELGFEKEVPKQVDLPKKVEVPKQIEDPKVMQLKSASLVDHRTIKVIIEDEMGSSRDIEEKKWYLLDKIGNIIEVERVIKSSLFSGNYDVILKLKSNLAEDNFYGVVYGDLSVIIDKPYVMPIPSISNIFTVYDNQIEVVFANPIEDGHQWTYTIDDLDKNSGALSTTVKSTAGMGMGRMMLNVNGVLTGDRYKLTVERKNSFGLTESMTLNFAGPEKFSPTINNTGAYTVQKNVVEIKFPSRVNIDAAKFTIKEPNSEGTISILSTKYINDKTIQLQTDTQKENFVYSITITHLKDYNNQYVGAITLEFASFGN